MLPAQRHVVEVRGERRAQLLRHVLVEMVGVASGIDVAVGRGDGQHAFGGEHACEFRDDVVLAVDVLDDLEADDDVEAPGIEGQRVDVADDERGVSGGALCAPASTALAERSTPDDLRGTRAGEHRAAVSDAAARVEHLRPCDQLPAQR